MNPVVSESPCSAINAALVTWSLKKLHLTHLPDLAPHSCHSLGNQASDQQREPARGKLDRWRQNKTLPSVSNCRQLWQVAKRCSWQRPVARSSLLVQPSRHVQLLLQSLNLENSFLLSAVLTSVLAFSLSLSLSLRTFLQQ